MSYSIYDYGRMLADTRRIDAYSAAICGLITPESVVIDLGAGLGYFALEAARAGAKKVYAIDPNPACTLAGPIAAAHGLCVEVIQRRVQEVVLEDKANVLVFDVRGALPLYQEAVAALKDARDRLCVKGATLLPERDCMYVALAHCPALFKEKQQPWGALATPYDLSQVSQHSLNSWYRVAADEQQFVGTPQHWATLDYASITSGSVAGEVSFELESATTVHGFYLYAEVQFPGGTSYSCKTPGDVCVSGSAFFPFTEPVSLQPDDLLTVALAAHQLADTHVWSWDSALTREGAACWSARQNTLHQILPAQASLHKRRGSYLPQLDQHGQIQLRTLQLFTGQKPLVDIAEVLRQEFPDAFVSPQQALAHVSRLSERFAQ